MFPQLRRRLSACACLFLGSILFLPLGAFAQSSGAQNTPSNQPQDKTEKPQSERKILPPFPGKPVEVAPRTPPHPALPRLLEAVRTRHAGKVKMILTESPNFGVDDLNEALLAVIENHSAWTDVGSEEIVSLLLQAGADVNRPLMFYGTPLYRAARHGRENIGLLLLARGGAVTNTPEPGKNVLVTACSALYIDMPTLVRRLVEAGANPDLKLTHGYTPLMFASWRGHRETVKYLLSMKVDVNAKTDDGLTALMLADQEGHTEICRMLIQASAYVNAQSRKGKTASIHISEEPVSTRTNRHPSNKRELDADQRLKRLFETTFGKRFTPVTNSGSEPGIRTSGNSNKSGIPKSEDINPNWYQTYLRLTRLYQKPGKEKAALNELKSLAAKTASEEWNDWFFRYYKNKRQFAEALKYLGGDRPRFGCGLAVAQWAFEDDLKFAECLVGLGREDEALENHILLYLSGTNVRHFDHRMSELYISIMEKRNSLQRELNRLAELDGDRESFNEAFDESSEKHWRPIWMTGKLLQLRLWSKHRNIPKLIEELTKDPTTISPPFEGGKDRVWCRRAIIDALVEQNGAEFSLLKARFESLREPSFNQSPDQHDANRRWVLYALSRSKSPKARAYLDSLIKQNRAGQFIGVNTKDLNDIVTAATNRARPASILEEVEQ